MAQSLPNQVYINVAKNSAKNVDNDRKRKSTEEAKESRRRSKYMHTDDTLAARKAYSRHDDGAIPDEVTEDIPAEHLKKLTFLKKLTMSFYNTKVVVNDKKAKEIEKCTRGQADDERWMVERRLRLTVSRVGSIIKMRSTTKRSKKVEELLYRKFRGNEATCYGSTKEETTIQQYITYQHANGHSGLKVTKCGLFVSVDNPWLAASPDGLVNDPDYGQGLLEIKNPYSAREKTLAEASTHAAFCLKANDNKYKLKTKHDFYYQIQCQLYCVNLDWCDFVLRTNKDIHVERIYKDSKWWSEQLKHYKNFISQPYCLNSQFQDTKGEASENPSRHQRTLRLDYTSYESLVLNIFMYHLLYSEINYLILTI